MILRLRNVVFGLALFVASPYAQTPANVGTILRSVATSVPGLSLRSVQQGEVPHQNSWMALYAGWQISVDVADSPTAAQWRLEHSMHMISVGHDRKETFEGEPLYVWSRYGYRLSYQTGPYAIHIHQANRQSDERLARTILDTVVRELKAARAKPEVKRTRDLPPDSPMALSWGPQGDYFREENFEIVPWEYSIYILTKLELRGGKQYHTKWLTIFGANGEKFLLLQPEFDWYLTLAKARDLELRGFATE